ncbi:MAG: NAD(P)/FAD-dependent oxidoreductase [Burkholderiaceae bacterium]
MERVETAVIGAGVVGLAIARELARRGREVVVLEAESMFGSQTSSRNSEVIHAGIYYPDNSLKAELCVSGRHALYEWCESAGVPYRRCGKLIVATDQEQVPVLAKIADQARRNGVDDLQWLEPAEIARMEPELNAVRALWSPSTGIIDSHGLMISLLGDAERHGAALAVCSRVISMRSHEQGVVLQVSSGGPGEESELELHADLVINSAGHGAIALARDQFDAERASPQPLIGAQWSVPQAFFSKGNYFRLGCKAPFTRLVYPVPEPGGLGVHLTLDLAGQARFGPDVQPVEHFDYEVDPSRGDRFYAAIRRYWPGLPDGALLPDYSGMRPRYRIDGVDATDFRIERHGRAPGTGLINLFGIESPGLTASLAIAERVGALSEA